MAELEIEPGVSLHFEHRPAAREGAPSFVFVNPLIATPLTPGLEIWRETATRLASEGLGTLLYDLREWDAAGAEARKDLEPGLLVSDLRRLAAEVIAAPPIFVGLGFGGLIAAGAVLDGAPASGLVLINGLIEVGERLNWVNAAASLLAEEGGAALQMDALLPLLVNPDYLETARAARPILTDYQRLEQGSALLNLYRNVAEADWSLPLGGLATPSLVISGLQDRVFLDRDVVNRRFAQLPDARAEAWEDAGHLLPAERPQQLARSLLRFSREIEGFPRSA